MPCSFLHCPGAEVGCFPVVPSTRGERRGLSLLLARRRCGTLQPSASLLHATVPAFSFLAAPVAWWYLNVASAFLTGRCGCPRAAVQA